MPATPPGAPQGAPIAQASAVGSRSGSRSGLDVEADLESALDTVPSTFEAALTELEAVVARMESGELSLEQSLSAYQRGAKLLQYCQAKLNDAQQQVKILEAGVLKEFSGAGENGQ